MTEVPRASTARRSRRGWLAGLLALSLVVAGTVLALDSDDSGGQPDAGSAIPCAHFRSVARDAVGGSMDAENARLTFVEIDAEASGATPEVKRAARRMLQVADKRDPATLIARSQDMATACGDAGH